MGTILNNEGGKWQIMGWKKLNNKGEKINNNGKNLNNNMGK